MRPVIYGFIVAAVAACEARNEFNLEEPTSTRDAVRVFAAIALAIAALFAAGHGGSTLRPSRDYHLQNVRVALRFDLDQRKVMGEVTHTSPRYADGLTPWILMRELTISSARVNGKDTTFELRKTSSRDLAQTRKSRRKVRGESPVRRQTTTGLFFILPDKDDPGRPKENLDQGEAEDTASTTFRFTIIQTIARQRNDSDGARRLADCLQRKLLKRSDGRAE